MIHKELLVGCHKFGGFPCIWSRLHLNDCLGGSDCRISTIVNN